MKKTAAKDRKRLRLAAVLALSMALLLPGVGEASRTLPPAFGAKVAPPITAAELLNLSRPDAPAARRFTLIDVENCLSFAALSVVGSADTACFSAPSHFKLFDLPRPIDRLVELELGPKTAYRRFFEPTERISRQTRSLRLDLRQGVYFLQPDPLGPVDSPNLYQGFGFDALNVVDPYGECWLTGDNVPCSVYAKGIGRTFFSPSPKASIARAKATGRFLWDEAKGALKLGVGAGKFALFAAQHPVKALKAAGDAMSGPSDAFRTFLDHPIEILEDLPGDMREAAYNLSVTDTGEAGEKVGATLAGFVALDMGGRAFSATRSGLSAEGVSAFAPGRGIGGWNEFQRATAGQFGSRAEAAAAWKVYKESSQASRTLVIGRLPDTEAAELAGFQRLNTTAWTPALNDAWVQGAIDTGRSVKLVSPVSRSTLFNPPGSRFPETIFLRELRQLKNAGYTIRGGWALPPGS